MSEQRQASLILFGGTFDPPHRAHVAVAEEILRRQNPETLVLVPAFQPVLAGGAAKQLNATFTDRLHMLSLAFADGLASGRVAISQIEASITPPIYTLKTLHAMQAAQPDAKLGFVMGQDQWAVFDRWHGPREILAMADVLVVSRPGFGDPLAEAKRVLGLLGLTYAEVGDNTISLATGHQVRWYPDVHMDVSSTALRTALKQNDRETAVAQLAPDVLSYIESKGLYHDGSQP